MEITKAREIIKALANGVDPTTGEILPRSCVYNTPEVIRALYTMLDATAPKRNSATKTHPNAGKPWTTIEDDKLKDEFASNIKISDIAKEHGRTYLAIESRLEYLGLKRKPFWLFKLMRKSTK